jgi:hypothetical protein
MIESLERVARPALTRQWLHPVTALPHPSAASGRRIVPQLGAARSLGDDNARPAGGIAFLAVRDRRCGALCSRRPRGRVLTCCPRAPSLARSSGVCFRSYLYAGVVIRSMIVLLDLMGRAGSWGRTAAGAVSALACAVAQLIVGRRIEPAAIGSRRSTRCAGTQTIPPGARVRRLPRSASAGSAFAMLAAIHRSLAGLCGRSRRA